MPQLIHSINILFENLDEITIPAHYFRDCMLDDIRTAVRRVAANAVMRYQYAGFVDLELRPDADTDSKTFDLDVHSIQYDSDTLFSRLQRSDITHITLRHADGAAEEISVLWEDADAGGYTNRLQQTQLQPDGYLRVTIGRKNDQ